ncbi:phage tail protein [Bosea sp. MMO-172]|uniref:phage tail protein n=1 Tax=Bosea sp. MMO-172 TaxID=3127885 RepID=UPI00301ABB63
MPVPPLEGAASPGERALLHAMTDALPVPIRQAVSPPDTPVAFLPFLAVHNGVRLWFGDWSVARKRAITAEWSELADLIGTRPGLVALLAYVDATLVSTMAHPRRFVIGRSTLDREPLNFPAFRARYLIKVKLKRHKRAFVIGRSALDRGAFTGVDGEPIRRARIAATVAKGPATQYLATFQWRRRPTFGDAIGFASGHHFGDFLDRASL